MSKRVCLLLVVLSCYYLNSCSMIYKCLIFLLLVLLTIFISSTILYAARVSSIHSCIMDINISCLFVLVSYNHCHQYRITPPTLNGITSQDKPVATPASLTAMTVIVMYLLGVHYSIVVAVAVAVVVVVVVVVIVIVIVAVVVIVVVCQRQRQVRPGPPTPMVQAANALVVGKLLLNYHYHITPISLD